MTIRPRRQKETKHGMKCHVCGWQMRPIITDLPFKVSESSIMIVKRLPVIQCDGCGEFLIEGTVMTHVETILAKAHVEAELEIVDYAV